MSRFAEIFASDQGVLLKLTAVLPAELLVKFEGQTPGTGLAVGLLNLAPGCSWPLYRFLTADQVFFVHKGQGRVTIGGRPTMVVPGMMVAVPRETWVSWRNTGTSPLQLMWSAEPAATLQCLRELAGLQTADPAALAGLAQRYGFEVQVGSPAGADPRLPPARSVGSPAGAEPSSPKAWSQPQGRGRRHRRGRGGRGGQRPAPAPGAASPTQPAPSGEPLVFAPASTAAPAAGSRAPVAHQPAAAASSTPATAGTVGGGSRHRRRGRGRGRGGRGGQRPPQTSAPVSRAPSPAAPAHETPSSPKPSSRSSSRVKEVYMRGRWIPVSGDGPMVDLGRRRRPEQFKRGRPPSSAGGENLSEEL